MAGAWGVRGPKYISRLRVTGEYIPLYSQLDVTDEYICIFLGTNEYRDIYSSELYSLVTSPVN
jgi:hypothetical protein